MAKDTVDHCRPLEKVDRTIATARVFTMLLRTLLHISWTHIHKTCVSLRPHLMNHFRRYSCINAVYTPRANAIASSKGKL